MVARPLCMRKAPGSIPGVSILSSLGPTLFFVFYSFFDCRLSQSTAKESPDRRNIKAIFKLFWLFEGDGPRYRRSFVAALPRPVTPPPLLELKMKGREAHGMFYAVIEKS